MLAGGGGLVMKWFLASCLLKSYCYCFVFVYVFRTKSALSVYGVQETHLREVAPDRKIQLLNHH